LTGVGFDVEGGEEFVVVGVVDKFGIADDDCFVGVLIVLLESFDAKLKVEHESGGYFYFLAAVCEAGALVVGEDADYLDEDVDELEDFSLIYLLVDFVLADVVGHVEESDQLQLELLEFESELHLHPLQRVGLHHQLDIFLEVLLHDLHLHLLLVSLSLALPALLPCLLLLLILHLHHHVLQALQFLLKLYVCDLFRHGRLLGEVLAIDAEGTNHLSVELFSKDDVVVEGRFDLEVLLGLFVEVPQQ
jgi:hypothetical protein